MAWTTPKTWADDELVTANVMNTHIRDNLNVLYERPLDWLNYLPGSDYTTTSTSWVDVDGTNLKLTVTPATSRVFVLATFEGYSEQNVSPANNSAFSFYDGTTRLGDSTYGLTAMLDNSSRLITVCGVFEGLTPDVEIDITLQYRVGISGKHCTIRALPIAMLAWEK